jgi:hypothetical protein
MTEVKQRFLDTITQFTNELSLSYPELSSAVTKYQKSKKQVEEFGALKENLKKPIAARDNAFFLKAANPGREILPGIYFSASLWKETTKETRNAFWDYLATLVLLHNLMDKVAAAAAAAAAATAVSDGEEMPDFEKVLDDMTEGFNSEEFKGMFANLSETLKQFAGTMPQGAPPSAPSRDDGEHGKAPSPSDDGSFPFPNIPERLQNGLIAKIAGELASEFKPEDLGIDPEIMEKMNPMQIFEHLQFVYTNNPTLLTSAMKRVAKKIQNKFSSGSLNRDALMSEAQELMAHFTNNPAFKDMFDTFGGLFNNPGDLFGGGGGGAQQSERLRKAKDRMRAKLDKKQQAKK